MKQHEKSSGTTKIKEHVSNKSHKDFHKTGTKNNDWNGLTGNSHLEK